MTRKVRNILFIMFDQLRHDYCADIIELMYQRLGQWARRQSQRITRSEQDIVDLRGRSRRKGILIGVYDGSEIDAELAVKYRGKSPVRYADDEA